MSTLTPILLMAPLMLTSVRARPCPYPHPHGAYPSPAPIGIYNLPRLQVASNPLAPPVGASLDHLSGGVEEEASCFRGEDEALQWPPETQATTSVTTPAPQLQKEATARLGSKPPSPEVRTTHATHEPGTALDPLLCLAGTSSTGTPANDGPSHEDGA